MTLRLAAFQHFCARFADAFLTSLNPLTYERGDALQAFEEENEVHEPCAVSQEMIDAQIDLWRPVLDALAPFDGPVSGAVPPAAPASPAPVDGTPPASPGAGPQLPMFKFSDLQGIAAEYIEDAVARHRFWHANHSSSGSNAHCSCGIRPRDLIAWEKHIAPIAAELAVSALVAELTGLAYDQSHPETQK